MENHHHEGAGHSGQNKNMMAVFSYLWVLIIIPFLTDSKSDPFVKFHLKQGLTLVIFEVVGMFIGVIPFVGWLVAWVMWIASFVFAVIGIMNVMNGQEKELPVIGQYAKNFNF